MLILIIWYLDKILNVSKGIVQNKDTNHLDKARALSAQAVSVRLMVFNFANSKLVVIICANM